MLKLGLLNPEVIKDENGIPIRVKNKETGKFEKVINKKAQTTNKGKKSKAKSHYVEEPIYNEYLRIIG
jgi:hypothetical protein